MDIHVHVHIHNYILGKGIDSHEDYKKKTIFLQVLGLIYCSGNRTWVKLKHAHVA